MTKDEFFLYAHRLIHFLHDVFRAYDFQSILTASSLIFGFAFGAPVAIWFLLKQINSTLKMVTVGCLYGYSLFVFIPATVGHQSANHLFIVIIH